ncbi:flagellar hook-length control protein FliK [Pseudomonas citronellolis]|uniref:flagellar hook-length control protein FliK n=1 Tax=Pseudomonas citronellolis TaxID=53408 RepID=UPI0023E40CEB|nr:flagellar hook-length control protein FliK [Pseudomonas citronellolis]MDF3933845.1 flagellar hook-length control protein FliK [Pseudomonas citronellolis]
MTPRLATDSAPTSDAPLPAMAAPREAHAMGRQVAARGAAAAAPATGDAAPELLTPAFGAQLAQSAEASAGADSDAEAAAKPDEQRPAADAAQAQPDPALGAAPAAEQWLANMLGQREVTLQARDGAPQDAADAASAVVARGMPGNLPLPQLPQGLPEAVQTPAQGQPLPSLPAQAKGVPAKAARLEESLASKDDTPLDEHLQSQLDKLASQVATPPAQQAAAAQPSNNPPSVAQAPASHGLERQLSLQAPTERWGEQMLNALRDSVELQLKHNLQSATIRLDPPELGRLEIYLNQDPGRLSVQIHAAQGDVARLLQQGVERLRQDIAGATPQAVEVQVADGRAGQQQAQQQAQQGRAARWLDDAPVSAAAAERAAPEAAERRPGDVLVTV